MNNQRLLGKDQLKSFYHNHFVDDQFRHFKMLSSDLTSSIKVIVDIGGGCGYFVSRLNDDFRFHGRVVDSDPISVKTCLANGIDAEIGDALNPCIKGDEDLVCFNLILHHLVGSSEEKTKILQKKAIQAWRGSANYIFINEYIYESFISNFSGRVVYEITKSKALSLFGRLVSFIVPSLKANTFGVGVRFRSNKEWIELFESSGFSVVRSIQGKLEPISFARRFLLIRQCRRDSFLLAKN